MGRTCVITHRIDHLGSSSWVSHIVIVEFIVLVKCEHGTMRIKTVYL